MQEMEEILNNVEIEPLELYSEHWVDVTYIIDPHKFYTRLTKHRDLIQKIETLQCTSTSRPPTIKWNDIVLFNLEEADGDEPKYARGKITRLLEKAGESLAYDVFALDYGFSVKNVSLDRIWVCDSLLQKIPPLAILCRLAYCGKVEGKWEKAIESFKYFVGKERAKIFIENKEDDIVTVSLYNSCPNDIATMLTLIDLTVLGGGTL